MKEAFGAGEGATALHLPEQRAQGPQGTGGI